MGCAQKLEGSVSRQLGLMKACHLSFPQEGGNEEAPDLLMIPSVSHALRSCIDISAASAAGFEA